MPVIRTLRTLLLALLLLAPPRGAGANVVVAITTVLGPIELELFDAVAPLTVANFLGYADSNAYDQSFFHRSVPNFVVQGGGYKIAGGTLVAVATNPPTVLNEPALSNVRGAVAMAKLGGLPDSATTEWFINVVDNVALDTSNGGFTVFAEVISGLAVVDAINVLPRVNIGSPLTELPVTGWTGGTVTFANLVMLTDVARKLTPACGDLDGDAQINALDAARIRGFLANPTGSALSLGEASRCSVAGTATDCNLLDATIVRRRLTGRAPKRAQICPAAL